MGTQVEVKTELLVAKSALKWFFTGVHKLVALELRVIEESFVTTVNWADVLSLAVSHHMFAQTGRVLEKFGTPKDVARVNATLFIACVSSL